MVHCPDCGSDISPMVDDDVMTWLVDGDRLYACADCGAVLGVAG